MIITVTNRKGGVGKSTMSAHIAAGLATIGYNVALVDTDSQGHAAALLGMAEEDGLYSLLIDKVPAEQVLREVPQQQYMTGDPLSEGILKSLEREAMPSPGRLYLVPSSAFTYRIPYLLEPTETFLFLSKMESIKTAYSLDVIIIDTSPTLSLFDGAIYLAADGVLYVTECEMLSFDGVAKAMSQMESFASQRQQYLQRDSRVIGIIPNKMRARTRLHRHNIRLLGEAFPGKVWAPVILGTIWTEATNSRELVYTYAPSGQEAADAWAIVKRTEQEVEAWIAVARS